MRSGSSTVGGRPGSGSPSRRSRARCAWPLGRLGEAAIRLRVAVLEKLPFFAVSLGVAWLTVAAQQTGGALETDMLSLGERESARHHYEVFVELDPPQFAPQIAEIRRKLASG